MARKFCDSLLTTGANDGSTFDDAYQSEETALEAALAVGDKLYIRRRSGFWNPLSDINPSADGNLANPIQAIGGPRNVKTGTGTFVQGSNIISGVSFVPKLEQHGTRMIKNDVDSREYMISAIAHKINYDNKSGDFTEGLMVTGAGGCEGKIHKIESNGETGSLWIVSKARELIDRGNCEDPIAPMIFSEFTLLLYNLTCLRSSEQAKNGTYSYKSIITVAATAQTIFAENTNGGDLHGHVPGSTYTLEVWIKIPSTGGIALDEVKLNITEYNGSTWETSESSNPTQYDVWQKLSVTRTLRSNATGCFERLITLPTVSVGECFYIDDVSLKNVFLDNEQITDEDTGVADVDGTPADDGFVILDNYAGTSEEDGALTIEKDEDYDDFQLIDDSTWTIKKVDWNGDADDLPIVDFGANNYDLYITTAFSWIYKNMYFKGSSSAYGMVRIHTNQQSIFINCIFNQSNNTRGLRCSAINNSCAFTNCIFFSSIISGIARYGIQTSGNTIDLVNCAFYNWYSAFYLYGCTFKNVNVGIELNNDTYDIYALLGGIVDKVGANVKLSGKNGLIYKGHVMTKISIENYQNLVGHRYFYIQGEMIKKDVLIASGDPYRRLAGAESVIEISCNNNIVYASAPDEWKYLVFEHEFEMDVALRNYRYYVQCKAMSIVNAGELYLECEYVDQYVSDSVYHMKKVRSDEVIAERTGADDWSQYLEVTGIHPAVKSKVRIKCFLSKYDADGRIFIDPKVGIFT